MLGCVPRLWEDSVQAHRDAVREATLDAAGAIIVEDGLHALTMSRLAQAAGIGRATLYKYFPDVEAVLGDWHERHIRGHLQALAEAAAQPAPPLDRLHGVLEAYAGATRRQHGGELVALLHQAEHVARAQQHLQQMLGELIGEAVAAGEVRDDISPAELATFCLHALTAAAAVGSDGALGRLVEVTLTGLLPSHRPHSTVPKPERRALHARHVGADCAP
jgi:AcrR family transcriptional regulator